MYIIINDIFHVVMTSFFCFFRIDNKLMKLRRGLAVMRVPFIILVSQQLPYLQEASLRYSVRPSLANELLHAR